jgi:hypothetical protein
MKALLAAALLLAAVGLLLAAPASPCSWCVASPCSTSAQCGYGCVCAGSGGLGTCVEGR